MPIETATTEGALDVLRSFFARYGLPKKLVSDNGPLTLESLKRVWLKMASATWKVLDTTQPLMERQRGLCKCTQGRQEWHRYNDAQTIKVSYDVPQHTSCYYWGSYPPSAFSASVYASGPLRRCDHSEWCPLSVTTTSFLIVVVSLYQSLLLFEAHFNLFLSFILSEWTARCVYFISGQWYTSMYGCSCIILLSMTLHINVMIL